MASPDGNDGERRGGLSRRDFLIATAGVVGGAVSVPAALTPAHGATIAPDFTVGTVLDGLRATVRATGPGEVRIRAWPLNSPSSITSSPWVATNAANAAELHLPLVPRPREAWAWQGVVRTGPGTTHVRGPVNTMPARPAPGEAARFTFAFGSCVTQGKAAPALGVVADADPVLFALLGDLGYFDDADSYPDIQNYAGYVAGFRDLLIRSDFRRLLAGTAFYGMQDDHDYGYDQCWRDTVQPHAAQAYADLIPGARWPEDSYRAWSIGEVDFFLTDNRRYRDLPANPPYENGRYASNLGSAQREWLFDGLAGSASPLKVVFAPMSLAWYWGRLEREEIQAFVNANVTGKVLFLTGDKHAAGFASFPDRIWEMLAGPIRNSTKHKTPIRTGVLWTENGAGPALSDCVGMVDVDTLSSSTATLRWVKGDGTELHRVVLPL